MTTVPPKQISEAIDYSHTKLSPPSTLKISLRSVVSSQENRGECNILGKIKNKSKPIFQLLKRSSTQKKESNLNQTSKKKNTSNQLTSETITPLSKQNLHQFEVENNLNQIFPNFPIIEQQNESINGNPSQNNLEDDELNSCEPQTNFNSFFLCDNEPAEIFPQPKVEQCTQLQYQENNFNNIQSKYDLPLKKNNINIKDFSSNNKKIHKLHTLTHSPLQQVDSILGKLEKSCHTFEEERRRLTEELSQSQSNGDEDDNEIVVLKNKTDNMKEQYSRREKSLEELSKKFLTIFLQKEQMMISLDKITSQLDVERRRIYDIINILESLKLVTRRGKNNYKWNGFDQIFETISSLDGHREDIDPSSLNYASESNEKKEKSLEILSIGFLKLFLNYKNTLSLEEAARRLSPLNSENQKIKTKIRRLYDIANVFKSLGLIKKVQLSDTKKPAFQWVGISGLEEFYNAQREFSSNLDVSLQSQDFEDIQQIQPPLLNSSFIQQNACGGIPPSPENYYLTSTNISGVKGGNLNRSSNSAFKRVNRSVQPNSLQNTLDYGNSDNVNALSLLNCNLGNLNLKELSNNCDSNADPYLSLILNLDSIANYSQQQNNISNTTFTPEINSIQREVDQEQVKIIEKMRLLKIPLEGAEPLNELLKQCQTISFLPQNIPKLAEPQSRSFSSRNSAFNLAGKQRGHFVSQSNEEKTQSKIKINNSSSANENNQLLSPQTLFKNNEDGYKKIKFAKPATPSHCYGQDSQDVDLNFQKRETNQIILPSTFQNYQQRNQNITQFDQSSIEIENYSRPNNLFEKCIFKSPSEIIEEEDNNICESIQTSNTFIIEEEDKEILKILHQNTFFSPQKDYFTSKQHQRVAEESASTSASFNQSSDSKTSQISQISPQSLPKSIEVNPKINE